MKNNQKEHCIYTNNAYYQFVSVYNYTLDTVPKFEENGWKLVGTYYNHLTFRKLIEED